MSHQNFRLEVTRIGILNIYDKKNNDNKENKIKEKKRKEKKRKEKKKEKKKEKTKKPSRTTHKVKAQRKQDM